MKAQEGLKEASEFAGHAISDALGDLVLEGTSAQEVVANLLKSFARMALQAAITGTPVAAPYTPGRPALILSD